MDISSNYASISFQGKSPNIDVKKLASSAKEVGIDLDAFIKPSRGASIPSIKNLSETINQNRQFCTKIPEEPSSLLNYIIKHLKIVNK